MVHFQDSRFNELIPGSIKDMCLVDAVFGKPIVVGDKMVVPVSKFSLFEGHPGLGTLRSRNIIQGELIFSSVISSDRITREYINDPRGTGTSQNPLGDKQIFGDPRSESDVQSAQPVRGAGVEYKRFSIDNGMMQGPPEAGLASWVIVAKDLHVRIIKARE